MFRKVEKYAYGIILLILLLSVLKNLQQASVAKRRIEKVRNAFNDLQVTNQELEDALKKVETKEYIETQVRDKLGLVKPGEQIIVLPDPEAVRSLSFRRKESSEQEVLQPNWKKWVSLFL